MGRAGRRGRLPADQVMWLVLGIALLRDRSMHDVARKFGLLLPASCPTVVPRSISETRSRLGESPMRWLFRTCENRWGHESAISHWSLLFASMTIEFALSPGSHPWCKLPGRRLRNRQCRIFEQDSISAGYPCQIPPANSTIDQEIPHLSKKFNTSHA